jgi:hypothetical protein
MLSPICIRIEIRDKSVHAKRFPDASFLVSSLLEYRRTSRLPLSSGPAMIGAHKKQGVVDRIVVVMESEK